MSVVATIQDVIFKALENLNEELDEEAKIEINLETKLFGQDATLDSLSLVSVIVDVESAISDAFDIPVSLTDDRAVSREISPFSNVTALRDYILELLSEAGIDTAN